MDTLYIPMTKAELANEPRQIQEALAWASKHPVSATLSVSIIEIEQAHLALAKAQDELMSARERLIDAWDMERAWSVFQERGRANGGASSTGS